MNPVYPGPVPAWTRTRLRYCISGAKNGAWGGEPGSDEVDVACLRVADFRWESLSIALERPTIRSVSREQVRNLALRSGDLLLEKSGGGEKTPVGRVVLFDGEAIEAITSNFVARVRPSRDVHPRFLLYLLATLYLSGYSWQFIKQNTGIQNLDDGALWDSEVYLPPVAEQRAIADFLDRETGRIDALIAKKERLIELLRLRHLAEIEHTVMGRYQQDRALRPSGVDWIGDFPDHWAVRRVIQVARLESGHTPSRNEPGYWIPEECTIPWFTLGDIWQVRQARQIYVRETNEKISPTGITHSAARLLPAETVILSRTASVGFPAILAVPMATTQDFVNWICGPKVVPEYLYFVFRSMRRELDRLMIGSTHQTIYMPDVRAFRMPLPTLDEQREIVRRLMQAEERSETLVSKTQMTIDRLREFRSALITAAVTGQIDPADWRKRGTTERALEAVEAAGEPTGVGS